MPKYTEVSHWSLLGGCEPSQIELRRLIKCVDPSELIKLACNLNLATFGFFGKLTQAEIITQLRKDGLIDDAAYKTLVVQKGHTITRPGMLELIRAAACFSKGSSRVTEKQKEFSKAIIHSFEIYNTREAAPTSEAVNAGSSLSPKEREKSYQSVAYLVSTLYRSHNTTNPLLGLARGLLLLKEDFFNINIEHRNRFEEVTQMSIEQYFDCLMGLLSFALMPRTTSFKDGYSFSMQELKEQLSPYGVEAFDKFLALESQDANEVTEALHCEDIEIDFFDKKPLRSRPLFKFDGDRFVVIDELFLAERASAGAFFHSINQKDARNSFGLLGEAGDRYVNRLIEEHTKEINHMGGAQISIANPRTTEGGELCDTCVISGKKIILCETKHVWLKADLIHKKNAKTFWDAVKVNYASEQWIEKKNKWKRFGINQLHHAVTGLVHGTLQAVDSRIALNEGNEIFPVLFAHDEMISAPFFGHCLALEFMHLFNEDELPQKSFFKLPSKNLIVHTPIIISVTELERFYSLEGSNELSEFLTKYSKKYPDRIHSFSEFLDEENISSKDRHLLTDTVLNEQSAVMKRLFRIS